MSRVLAYARSALVLKIDTKFKIKKINDSSQTEETADVAQDEFEIVEELRQYSSVTELDVRVLVYETHSQRCFAESVEAADDEAQDAYFAIETTQE